MISSMDTIFNESIIITLYIIYNSTTIPHCTLPSLILEYYPEITYKTPENSVKIVMK